MIFVYCNYLVFVIVPAPTLSLSVLSDSLVAGGVEDVTLTCIASLDLNVVDNGDLEFSFSWRDRENMIKVAGGRISINSSPTSNSAMLTLSPLGTADTNISCTVIVAERQDQLEASPPGSKSTTIDIQSKWAGMIDLTNIQSKWAGITNIWLIIIPRKWAGITGF